MSGVATAMRRPAGDRVILGVCAAVARRIELDVTLVRILAGIGLVVFTVPFLVAYAGLALVVPRDDGRMLIGGEPADRRESLIGWTLVLLAAGLVIATPALFGLGDGINFFELGVLLIGASVIAIAVSRSQPRKRIWAARGPEAAASAEPVDPAAAVATEPMPGAEPTEPMPVAAAAKPPSIFAPVFGGITALLGLGAVLIAVFDLDPTPVTVAVVTGSLAIACGGVAIVTFGRRGTFPLLAIGALLALVAATAAVGRDEFDRGVGFRELQPLTVAEVESGYDYGIGAMEIDLRRLELPPGRTTMPVQIGFGFAEVIVPEDLQVVSVGDGINGDLPAEGAGAGEPTDSAGRRGKPPAPPVLVVDAEIGAGTVEISRRGGG